MTWCEQNFKSFKSCQVQVILRNESSHKFIASLSKSSQKMCGREREFSSNLLPPSSGPSPSLVQPQKAFLPPASASWNQPAHPSHLLKSLRIPASRSPVKHCNAIQKKQKIKRQAIFFWRTQKPEMTRKSIFKQYFSWVNFHESQVKVESPPPANWLNSWQHGSVSSLCELSLVIPRGVPLPGD